MLNTLDTLMPKKQKRPKVQEYDVVFFIGMWGSLALNLLFINAFTSKYHIAGLVETHTLHAQDVDLQAKCRARGYTASTTFAMQYSDTKDSHSGEPFSVSTHPHAIPIDQVIINSVVTTHSE